MALGSGWHLDRGIGDRGIKFTCPPFLCRIGLLDWFYFVWFEVKNIYMRVLRIDGQRIG
jgi:hypothetical protein